MNRSRPNGGAELTMLKISLRPELTPEQKTQVK